MTAEPAGFAVAVLLAVAAAATFSGRSRARQRLRRLQHPPWRAGTGSSPGTNPGGQRAAGSAGLDDTAMMLELIGAMLDAGSGLGRAMELIADLSAPEFRAPLRPVVAGLAIGAGWDSAWRSSNARSPRLLELRDALGFAALTGAPSSAVLYARAARIRRERFRAAEKEAAALGVRLVVPLGLCSLPAFVCLGILPVLLAMIPG